MKEKLIYVLSFVLAFALVTGALIYLNSTFRNIFAFDFTSIHVNNLSGIASAAKDSSKVLQTQTQPAAFDSVKSSQQIAKAGTSVTAPKDSTANLKNSSAIAETKKIEKQQTMPVNKQVTESPKAVALREFDKTIKDSTYKSWIKKTVKLYEEMDAKRAAKVILGYSDNIARDILFSMKKKKAAEILTEFKPEVATRIINYN